MAPLTLAEAIAARIVGNVDNQCAPAPNTQPTRRIIAPPQVVVFPKNDDDVAAVLEICRERGVALTSRGGGTSVAGNAVGPVWCWTFPAHE